MRFPLSPVAIALRVCQIIFALLLLILGAVAVADIDYRTGYSAVAIVSGIFSLLFYVPLLIPAVVRFYTPAVVLGLEFFLCLWWLIAFACAAHAYGDASCDWYFLSDLVQTGCKAGKATIAFGVLGWILSIITVTLAVIYAVVPASKSKGYMRRDYYSIGAVFPLRQAQPPADAEAAIEGEKSVEAEGDQFARPDAPPVDPSIPANPDIPVEPVAPVPPAQTH